jgi:hypothetical protein
VPYATPQELADALRITVTAANQDALTACLEAAAIEINDAVDTATDLPPNALLNRVNVLRGVEWWKANDAAFGAPAGAGSLETPASSFARHSITLTPLKTTFGVA